MKINRIYRNAARLIAVTAIVTVPGFAFALTCRAGAGGPAFSPSDVREVTAAAVQARGAEQCDVVYHVDGKRFDLGGCDREYVGEWAPRDGTPIGSRHKRLPLACQ